MIAEVMLGEEASVEEEALVAAVWEVAAKIARISGVETA